MIVLEKKIIFQIQQQPKKTVKWMKNQNSDNSNKKNDNNQ